VSGAGPLEEKLRAQVRTAGLDDRIHFPGFLQYHELPRLYARAGALVLASLSDQWGLVVNEAMAAGLPVLVSERCGCAPDLVENGGNGYTFDPQDVAGLAILLGRMAASSAESRRAMGRRSSELVARVSLEAFAKGVRAAVAHAGAAPRSGAPLATRVALALLIAARR
jgi:1,2-diacylglycerol 3-alpha-glucosyltransferase